MFSKYCCSVLFIILCLPSTALIKAWYFFILLVDNHSNSSTTSYGYFLSADWQPHNQSWPTAVGKSNSILFTTMFFDTKVTGNLITRLGSWAQPTTQWGLNQDPSNSLATHYLTELIFPNSSYKLIIPTY